MWIFIICALIALIVIALYSGMFMHGDMVDDI